VPSSTPERGEGTPFGSSFFCPGIGKQASGHRDTVDLPLALVGIVFLSAEEAHPLLVVDVLRTIDDLGDFLQSTNSVLAKQSAPTSFWT
jgi:hypothetical protein